MTEAGSKQMIITVDTKTGKVVKVVDENGNEATRVGPERLEKIYNSEDGFKYVGSILHAHASPECVYIIVAGYAFVICY